MAVVLHQIWGTHALMSVSLCRAEAGMVHSRGGHQSAAEPQTRPCRVPAEASAQLLPDQWKLYRPEPATK